MSFKLYKFCKMTALAMFCVLSLGGIFSGLALTVMKSPEQHANLYASQARLVQSQEMALIALSYRPYDLAMWNLLRDMEQQTPTHIVSVPRNSMPVLAVSNLSSR